jgi:hypothetical protein
VADSAAAGSVVDQAAAFPVATVDSVGAEPQAIGNGYVENM